VAIQIASQLESSGEEVLFGEAHPRLLLVEDSPHDAILYTAMLRWSALSDLFDVVHVSTLTDCVATFADVKPACILLDLGLPDTDGIEGIERIRSVSLDVPVVVLTGTDDDTLALDALKSGAQDYLVKSRVDSKVLTRSVHDAIARMRGEQRISFLAFHDSLTELPNRALFADRLQMALAHAQRRIGLTPVVLVIDLDRFTAVNDRLGQSSGDLLLRAIARRLEGAVHCSDTVARLGGNQFAILCEGAPAAEAIGAAQQVIDLLAAPFVLTGAEVFVGASVGIAVALPNSTDSDRLLRDADLAMYRAKADGGGRFVVFEEDMRAVVPSRHGTPWSADGMDASLHPDPTW
jgi:diguanylate cyclase (GGDEF)-like protein